MGWLIAIFVLAAAAAALALWQEDDPARRRLAEIAATRNGRAEPRDSPDAQERPGPGRAPRVPGLMAAMATALARLGGGGTDGSGPAAVRLQRAGLRLRPSEFLLLRLAAAAFGAAAGAAAAGIWAGAAAGAAGLALPSAWLAWRIAARRRALEAQLSDAIGIMSGALRSGYALLQAMQVVSREMPDPVAGEFARVLREARVGVPLDQALTDLSRRTGSRDVDLMVTAILIQRQVGGNLSEVLDRIGDTVRERLRLGGQVRALTAQGRLSGLIVGALPAVLGAGMMAINPGYVGLLFRHPLGLAMLAVAAAMQITGVLIIRRLVMIDL